MEKKRVQATTAAAIMAIGVLSSPCVDAAVKTYIKIGDIKGESTDLKYKDWVDVLSWSWGMSQTGSRVADGRRRVIPVCVQDLTITKHFDASSPDLIMGTAMGDHYPEVDLALQRTGETPIQFMNFKMADVVVSSYSTEGGGDDGVPVEKVTFTFQSGAGEYLQPPDDTKSGATIQFEVDASRSKCR